MVSSLCFLLVLGTLVSMICSILLPFLSSNSLIMGMAERLGVFNTMDNIKGIIMVLTFMLEFSLAFLVVLVTDFIME